MYRIVTSREINAKCYNPFLFAEMAPFYGHNKRFNTTHDHATRLDHAVVSIGCGDLEKSDKVSKTKRERDSTEQVAARNWAKERTTVPLREAELGGE